MYLEYSSSIYLQHNPHFQEDLDLIDINRRSSLGAESLLEHDIGEDSWQLEPEGEFVFSSEVNLGSEYADDIFSLKRQLEKKYHPRFCIANQPQVS